MLVNRAFGEVLHFLNGYLQVTILPICTFLQDKMNKRNFAALK